jgi:hypothetical protein
VKRSGKRPKDVRQKLKLCSGKERLLKANENYRIPKRIVEKATGANRGGDTLLILKINSGAI